MAFHRTSTQYIANGVSLPEPSGKVKIEHNNIAGADSGRTEDGKMHIDWVRRDVAKVTLTWDVLDQDELTTVVNAMQGKEFSFTFPYGGGSRTIQGYVGSSSYEHYMSNWRGTGHNVYLNVSISVVEL